MIKLSDLIFREGKPQVIEEDNPVLFKKAVGILTMKLFADLGETICFIAKLTFNTHCLH